MAARITEVRRKKILADYLETENYRETGRRNGVSDVTVRKLVMENSDFKRAIEAKKSRTKPTSSRIWTANAIRCVR